MHLKSYAVGLLLSIATVLGASIPGGDITPSRAPKSIFKRAFQPGKFVLTNLVTQAFPLTSGANRQISFSWADSASNSSISCSATWLQTNLTSTQPTSYISCAPPSSTHETWRWYFKSFDNLGVFSLQFVHIYKDDYYFPPPYDYPAFFGNVSISLYCIDGRSYEACVMPAGSRVVEVPIDGISD